MKKLNPNKLFVEYLPPLTPLKPIVPRRYTLTHSDITGQLFLTIGPEYALEKINPMRDEVLGEWNPTEDSYFYNVYVYVSDATMTIETAALRYSIFKRELPLALEAIRYGDNDLFRIHPELDDVPIYVYFMSSHEAFNRIEGFGCFREYR